MKIALAQIDTTVGAFAENAAAIVRQSREAAAAGAQLVLFPELTLCGYPPKDLLALREFVQRQLAALEQLAADPIFRRVPARVGFAEPHRGEGAGLFNACALLRDGKIAAAARKSLLPTYDVFDEARYFDPSPEVTVVEVAGVRVGLSICEDLWNDKIFWQKPRYARDPMEELARQGTQVLVNLSASPYALGKAHVRREMVAAAARRHGIPIALCNLVGGNDSLVFDGRALGVSARGGIQPGGPGPPRRRRLGADRGARGARARPRPGDGHRHALALHRLDEQRRRRPPFGTARDPVPHHPDRGDVPRVPVGARADLPRPQARRHGGEPAGPHPRDASHGVLEQDGRPPPLHRQQERAGHRVFHPLRGHGRRSRS